MPTRKLIAFEEQLRRLETTLGAGYWTFDCRSGDLVWSPGFYRLLGLKPEAVLPDFSISNGMVHPDDRLDHNEIVGLIRNSSQTIRKIRIIRPDGHLLWVRSQIDGLFDRSGNLISIHGILIDISKDQVEREEAAKDRALAQSLRKLTEGALWRAAPDGRLLDLGHWIRVTGNTIEESQDWDTLASIHPDDRAEFRSTWEKGIRQKTPISYRIRIRDISGRYVAYETRALPIEDQAGNLMEWHGCSLPVRGTMTFSAASITSAHIRAARALLDWSGPELADKSGVSFSTIKRMEKSVDLVRLESINRAKATLEEAGIRFAPDENGEIWVTRHSGA